MNWKLILGAIGTISAVGLVLYTSCGSCEDSAMSGRTGSRRNSAGSSPPTAATAKAPTTAPGPVAATHPAPAPAPPMPATSVAPIPIPRNPENIPAPVAPAVAVGPKPGVAAPSLAPPPARQRGEVSKAEPDRVRHTLLRLARIQMAIDDFSRANHGRLPGSILGPDGKTPLLSWRVAILPFLGYGELYTKFHFEESWDSPHNQQLLAEIPLYYQSPERGDEKTNYLATPALGMRIEDITDGLNNTLLLVEADDSAAVAWTQPRDLSPANPRSQLGQLRPAGFFAVWCSGLVSLIPNRVTPGQLAGAITPAQDDSDSYLLLSEPVGPKVASAGSAVAVAPVAPAIPAAPGRRAPDEPEDPPAAPVRANPAVAAQASPAGTSPKPSELAANSLNSLQAMAALSRSGIRTGQEPPAFQLAYAAAALDSEPKGQAATIQWVPGLKRPAIGIRWGIGVELVGQGTSVPLISPGGKARVAPKKMHAGLSQMTGELGQRFVEYLQVSAAEGQFGALIQKCVSQADPTIAPNMSFTPSNAIHTNECFFPGIAFLGRGNTKQLLAWAQQDAIDVLVIFQVDCKIVARTGQTYSETNIAILDAARGVQLYVTPAAINSRKVEIDRATEREAKDPVAAFMEKPLEFASRNLKMEPLPTALTSQPAVIKSRVEALVASEPRDRLATLAEIRSYQMQGLIDVATFKVACQKLLDDDAADKLAANVPFEVRLQAVQRWLPKLRAGAPVTASALPDE